MRIVQAQQKYNWSNVIIFDYVFISPNYKLSHLSKLNAKQYRIKLCFLMDGQMYVLLVTEEQIDVVILI